MAITVFTLTKPWLWVEKAAGGSLPINTTFYFIGYMAYGAGNGAYYGYAPSNSSDQVSVTTDTINKKIRMEIYEKGGYTSSFSNAGSGKVTVTSNAHGLANLAVVYIRNSANYTGKFTISDVALNTFNITTTWVSDDGISNWYNTPGITDTPANSDVINYFYYKWDYYSMLRLDGTKYQWLNLNDPTNTYEWYSADANIATYGHKRWGGAYITNGMLESAFTTDAITSAKYRLLDTIVLSNSSVLWNTTNLYERTATGTLVSGLMAHPEIALRKYSDSAASVVAYQLPNGLSENQPAVLINIDNTNSNNGWTYLIAALRTANLFGKCVDILSNGIPTDANASSVIIIRGIISTKNIAFTTQPEWISKTIIMIHGIIQSTSSDNLRTLLLTNSYVMFEGLASAYWIQPRLSVKNTRIDGRGSSYFVDVMGNIINYTPYGIVNAPSGTLSKDGYNFLGRTDITTNFTNQLRYIPNNAYIRNSTFTYIVLGSTCALQNCVFELTNCEFKQLQSDNTTDASKYNMDIFYEDSYVTGILINYVCNCYNVISNERSNDLVRIKYSYVTSILAPLFNVNSTFVHNFYFSMDANVVDAFNVDIAGASVIITNSNSIVDTYTLTTDSNGNIPSTWIKCYLNEYDVNNSDGYWYRTLNGKFYSKTTLINSITIVISKSGYLTQTLKFTQLSALSVPITLVQIPSTKLFTRFLNIFNGKGNDNTNPIKGSLIQISETNFSKSDTTGIGGQSIISSDRRIVFDSTLNFVEQVDNSGIWQQTTDFNTNITENINVYTPILVITSVDIITPDYGIVNGSIIVSVSGGTAPYQYSLDNITYQSSNIFSGLASGVYNIYVIDINTNGDNISGIEIPNSNVQYPQITSVDIITPDYGIVNGSITMSVSGGTTPYEYSLDNIIYQSSNIFSGLASGKYSIYVKDSYNLIDNISGIEIPNSNVQYPQITSIDTTNPEYNQLNGVIIINASGGTTPYEYSLDNITYQSGNTFTDLGGGEYNLYVKDNDNLIDNINGIKLTTPITISPIIDNIDIKDASNLVNLDGSIMIHVVGGVKPYKYSINGENYQSNNIFNELGVGTYTISVIDMQGIISTISGIRIKSGTPIQGATGRRYDNIRYTAKVNVKNIKISDVDKDVIKVKVIK